MSAWRSALARLPWLALLRAAILGAAALTLARPYLTPPGLAALGLGVFLGSVLADQLERWLPPGLRLRPRAALGFAGLWALGLGGAALLLVREPALARLLGAVGGAVAAEVAGALALAAPAAFGLRSFARRGSSGALLEVAAAGSAFAAAFAVHRGGMLHRPLGLGDFAWARGIDPAALFLVLGALATLGLSLLLMLERRPRRLGLQIASLCALLALLLLGIWVVGLPAPQTPEGLGLAGEPLPAPDATQQQQRERRPGRERREPPSRSLDDLSFRDDYGGGRSNAPVAVVVLHDDYAPPGGVFYFRQTAFSEFDGRRLAQSQRDDLDRDVVRFFPARPTPMDGPVPGRGSRSLVRISVGLLVDHVRPFALDTPVLFAPEQRGAALRFQRAYRAESLVLETPIEALLGVEPRADRAGEIPDLRSYLGGPDDARYAALGREIASSLLPAYREDPVALGLAVKDYLEREGIYSLRSQHASASDPTGSFLFGDRTGYCVHFAHAAAYLLRGLGVPTRVATGYAIPERDRGSGSALLLRGMNAHAWAELYLPGAGWLVVDAWPRRTENPPPPPPDPDLQRMLGEMLREQLSGDEQQAWQEPPLSVGELGRGLALALLALLLAGFAVRLARRGAPGLAPRGARERLRFVAVLDALAEAGLARRRGETRERFAARAARVAPSFSALTGLRLARNLGRGSPGELEASRGLARAVRSELRRGVPLWRRWLGRAHPFIWWRVR